MRALMQFVFSGSSYTMITSMAVLCFLSGMLFGYVICWYFPIGNENCYQIVGCEDRNDHINMPLLKFILKLVFAIFLLMSGIDLNSVFVYIIRMLLSS